MALLARPEAPPKAAAGSPAPSARPMAYQGAARHPVREIVVHCSDTLPDWYQGLSAQAKRGEISASWAGYVAYDVAANTLTISVEALVSAIVSGIVMSAGVFRRWGVK